jgi:hypothetical protein
MSAVERHMKHWEMKHHLFLKVMLSPVVAAALIALFGTILTVALGLWNLHLQKEIDAARQENALVIELMKLDDDARVAPRLRALARAGLLPSSGQRLHEMWIVEQSEIRTPAPAN